MYYNLVLEMTRALRDQLNGHDKGSFLERTKTYAGRDVKMKQSLPRHQHPVRAGEKVCAGIVRRLRFESCQRFESIQRGCLFLKKNRFFRFFFTKKQDHVLFLRKHKNPILNGFIPSCNITIFRITQ